MNFIIICYLFVQLECAGSAGMIAVVYLGVPFMQQLLLDEVCVCVYMLVCDGMTLLDENC
jgi:hypothetical protein